MNIIDAVKSGKRFRRKSVGEWHERIRLGFCEVIESSPGVHRILTVEEILADDWELEENCSLLGEK